MDEEYREVRFDLYCETCKHKDKAEEEDPCVECLEEPLNQYTDKPVKWEENKNRKQRGE